MSLVPGNNDLSNVQDTANFMRLCARAVNAIISAVNGKLEFDKNLNTQTVAVTFTSSNTEQAVTHTLNRVVKSYFVVQKDQSCDVYKGDSTSDTKKIYLKCTQAATVSIVLW